MIDPDLLKILACPDTHHPLTEADESALAALNERVQAAGCKNVGGESWSGGGMGKERWGVDVCFFKQRTAYEVTT